MKRPIRAPDTHQLVVKYRNSLGEILEAAQPTVNGKYLHFDELRHRESPEGLNHEQWWLGIKFARRAGTSKLPLQDKNGVTFKYSMTPEILEALHTIDSKAAGRIAMPESVTTPGPRERFLVRSLVEEAITSSQLEGASTTRAAAMDMIRSGRSPSNKSERMIFNNVETMGFIRDHQKDPMTPQLVLQIHRKIADGTLSDDAVGRLQTPADERIHVSSHVSGEILHQPPPADQLADRLAQMCTFANGQGHGEFLHPVIRAVVLHLWLGYDHPFEDGNGRVARALFYWAMLHHGYWLFEFISISNILRKASAQYGRSYLFTETDENDATYFILYQLEVIKRALHAAERYLELKTKQITESERLLRDQGEFNYRQLALLSHALRKPHAEYTVKSHQVSHDVAYATARADLRDLVARGLLEEFHPRGARAVVYKPSRALAAMVV
jgi:Fic family protein